MTIPSVKSLLDFSNQVVIVTGSGSGLGQGLALRFAEAGARVVVHYRTSAEGAVGVVDQIVSTGGEAVAVKADLATEAGGQTLIQTALRAFDRVDVLINNAGQYPRASVLDMTVAEWDEVLNAGLRSAFVCTQAFARQIKKQKSGGAIVNITSIEAENPAPDHSHYNAAKGGLLMYTRSCALELAALNIRVNSVAPGLIWREGIEQAWPDGVGRWQRTAPLKRLGQPEDVADACLFLASAGARWITGASLTVDGGVLTHQIY
jgi:NAD(P)-dependent dehydrogenase (short-subunit alcohol dehydrogenase family)